jgi:gamma-glutamyltranspeptidase/glutathione hydrolase
MKGAVASGHPLTSEAAARILRKGGNAFDAAVGAGFASIVAEPTLTSLGGGGFLLAHIASIRKDILFDFFVNTPGISHTGMQSPSMTPIEIQFPGCIQVFHTGHASVAVPGTLKGFLHLHDRLCTLPLDEIVEPAMSYLRDGVEVNERQAIFLSLLEPIMTASGYGRKIFTKNGRYAAKGDILYNPDLLAFFEGMLRGESDIYSGPAAEGLITSMKDNGGLMTEADLAAYRVIEREPLRIRYGDREILTNPPPSLGGIKLNLSLEILNEIECGTPGHEPLKYWITLADVMEKIYHLRPVDDSWGSLDMHEIIKGIRESAGRKLSVSSQGTTHISIIDEHGNAASMTTSNGSGSGCFIPGTGIMLNNMMGEDDLHPDGFFSSPPGQRVSSMMLPAMVTHNGVVEYVMGSGGSKRIRSAILQTILNLLDSGMSIREAVEAPRIHFEDDTLHAEPGIHGPVLQVLGNHYNLRRWEAKDMYFGGVHCVGRDMQGWGDSRRGGSFIPVL